MKNLNKNIWIYFFFFSSLILIFSKVYGVLPKDRTQYLKLTEIIQIIEIAKEAGYTDEELKSLVLKDFRKELEIKQLLEMMELFQKYEATNPELKKIILEEELLRRKKIGQEISIDGISLIKKQIENQKNKEKLFKKKYLTIQDIFLDLESSEEKELNLLRDQLLQ